MWANTSVFSKATQGHSSRCCILICAGCKHNWQVSRKGVFLRNGRKVLCVTVTMKLSFLSPSGERSWVVSTQDEWFCNLICEPLTGFTKLKLRKLKQLPLASNSLYSRKLLEVHQMKFGILKWNCKRWWKGKRLKQKKYVPDKRWGAVFPWLRTVLCKGHIAKLMLPWYGILPFLR